MTSPSDPLPADLAAAHAMILAQRELLTLAKSEVTVGRLEIERLKLMLAKARREQYGQSSECSRLLRRRSGYGQRCFGRSSSDRLASFSSSAHLVQMFDSTVVRAHVSPIFHSAIY